LGELSQAIKFFGQALAIAREIGNRIGEGAALGNMGLVYATLGDSRRAITLYDQRLLIARETGDRRGEAIARSTIWVLRTRI
jgi:tetratricopeptide (TPR) repeat protein